LISLNSCGFSQKDYTHIPRTRVSITIPEGYKIMNANTGLLKNSYEFINIMDLVGGNFYTNAKDFNKRSYEQGGIKVYEYFDTIVSGFPAKMMLSNTDDKNLNGISLVFGDTTFSTMIMSVHKSSNKQLEDEIKEALLTIKYNKNIVIDPFEDVKFTVDTTSTVYKLLTYSGNMYIFTPYGKDNNEDKSMVSIIPTLYDKTASLRQMSQLSFNGFVKHGMYGFVADSTDIYKINDTDALLKTGDFYAGTDRMYFYQLILAKDDYSLIVFGMCDYENQVIKREISNFCKKVKLKN